MRAAVGACLLLLLCCAALVDARNSRALKRANAKRWKRVAEVSRLKAKSAARQFLENAGTDLTVPIEIEVVLAGFSGDGGYGYHLDEAKLLSMLSSHLQWYCPYSWETEEEVGVCLNINFQIVNHHDTPIVGTLLHRVESWLRKHMVQSHTAYDQTIAHTAAAGYRTFYTVEGARMEEELNEFMYHLFKGDTGEAEAEAIRASGASGAAAVLTSAGKAAPWHKHNVIFVLNPSKVRMNPANAWAHQHVTPNIIDQWKKGNLNATVLEEEEAGYVYRYQYNGVGESTTWLSSRNYLVIDLAAGPSAYGPLVSQGGAVTPQAVPSIHNTYAELLLQLKHVEQQMTVQEAAAQAADRAQFNLLSGRLASTISAAVKAAFIPDMASQHIEAAKTVLVPLVVLTDAPLAQNPAESVSQENWWGINVTHIEAALTHMMGEGQEAVVVAAQHELHQHKQLAAALHKATRSHSEAVVDVPEGRDYQGTEMGLHVASHTFIDPDVLLEEFERSADLLTHGLTSVAHAAGKEEEHHIAQLRHEGTRVLPVFVLALQNHPEDMVLNNRELVAANHDAIIVLQMRQGTKWGGPNDFYTGHMANGRRVVVDGKASTRHVIAGLAQALTGVVPPYMQYEPALDAYEYDWRWATGAIPWGPYGNFSGVSEIMQNNARRNSLLSHISAALRQLQHQLDAVDAFVGHHFQGPWEAAGLKDGRRHWLDTVASTRHGYNSTLNANVVATIEESMGQISRLLEQLSMDMFSHDFMSADVIVSDQLLPAVGKLCTFLDEQLDAAEEVMQCCHMGGSSLVSQAMLVIMTCAGAAAVFFMLVGVALLARMAKKKAGKGFALPTYGLPTYSGKSGMWSL